MRDRSITLFNYHEKSATWYPNVISGVSATDVCGNSFSTQGTVNASTFEATVYCDPGAVVKTASGRKQYISPHFYASCQEPDRYVTFAPDTDFIFDGVWPEQAPIPDAQYEEGLYNALNASHDGIYKITSAGYYALIPHFELGGK